MILEIQIGDLVKGQGMTMLGLVTGMTVDSWDGMASYEVTWLNGTKRQYWGGELARAS